MKFVFQLGGFWVSRLCVLGPYSDAADVTSFRALRGQTNKNSECLLTNTTWFGQHLTRTHYGQ